jgi:hypothetical protein
VWQLSFEVIFMIGQALTGACTWNDSKLPNSLARRKQRQGCMLNADPFYSSPRVCVVEPCICTLTHMIMIILTADGKRECVQGIWNESLEKMSFN